MDPPVKEGDVLDGKYRVERVLGEGGMGIVVAAEHLQLKTRVALKFLHSAISRDGEIVARFLREAQAASRISNEHVARVIDVGTLGGGAPYMVLEYLSGQDLDQQVQRHGRLEIADAVDYVLQACEALAEAHSAGIVHRDLKPANLFRTQRADGSCCIKVLDFGISKVVGDTDARGHALTQTSGVMGSPQYMSPEQIRSAKNVDARSDIWSLGVILHELIAGKPPFDADSVTGLLAVILSEPPRGLAASRSDVPPQLEGVVLRCLEKRREDRFPNVAALARALQPFGSPRAALSTERIAGMLARGAATGASDAPPPDRARSPRTMGTAGSWHVDSDPAHTRKGPARVAVAAAIAATIAVAAVVLFVFRASPKLAAPPELDPPPAAASPPPLAPPAPAAQEASSASTPEPAPTGSIAPVASSKAPSRPPSKTAAVPGATGSPALAKPAAPTPAPASAPPPSDPFNRRQ